MLFIDRDDYDPPETATPEPEDELTGVGDGWTPLDVVPEVVVDPEDVETLEEATCVEVATPGIT